MQFEITGFLLPSINDILPSALETKTIAVCHCLYGARGSGRSGQRVEKTKHNADGRRGLNWKKQKLEHRQKIDVFGMLPTENINPTQKLRRGTLRTSKSSTQ